MKKFFGGVKKNIFYISLITGMAVLVTVLGLYNAKTNSKEKHIVIGQDTPYGDTSGSSQGTKETLSGNGRNGEGSMDKNVARDTMDDAQDTESDETGAADIEDDDQDTAAAGETTSGGTAKETGVDGKEELHYDPENSISWPIVGNVLIPYSMDSTVYFETLNEYKCNPAIIMEAKPGDEVKAVYECEVKEVSSSPEIGNYVKLDLGDGYTVTLGQLQDVSVALGSRLEMGDVIGTVGEPSRFYSEEGTNLYFSIDKNGQPVDPTLLIQ